MAFCLQDPSKGKIFKHQRQRHHVTDNNYVNRSADLSPASLQLFYHRIIASGLEVIQKLSKA